MDNKKIAVILEKEELIAQLRLNIARGKRRLSGLDDEKLEISNSLPQWEVEITKLEKDIKQIEGDKA